MTHLEKILAFRKAFKDLESVMGRMRYYDEHGVLILDSGLIDEDGGVERFWAYKQGVLEGRLAELRR